METLCAACDAPLPARARRCRRCGAPVLAAAVRAAGSGPVAGDRARTYIVAGTAAALVLFLMLGFLLLFGGGGDPQRDSAAPAPVASTTPEPSATDAGESPAEVEETPTETADASPTASATPTATSTRPDIRTLPAGLFCRDLAGRGYTLDEATAYWELHGRPDRMDADLNGVPCETVY